MIIDNATAKCLRQIARKLGIQLLIQKAEKGTVKCRIWPTVGKNQFRAKTKTSRPRLSLCYHAQHYFMAHVFVMFPDAIIKTWVMRWNYQLFSDGAVNWTNNEIADRADKETCDCTPEMIDEALVTPEQLRANMEVRGEQYE